MQRTQTRRKNHGNRRGGATSSAIQGQRQQLKNTSKDDCGPGGPTFDGLTMQVDGFTMQNDSRNTSNDGLTVSNVCEKASRMQKRFLDGIPLVKAKLCGMWNAIIACGRWRSDAAIDAVLRSVGPKFVGDAYGAEEIIARRNLVANQALSALNALASYAWICVFLGWIVSEILTAVCRIDMPEIGGLLDEDRDRYKSYINQSSMILQTLVATIIPPLYLGSSWLVAISFTIVVLFSKGFTNVTPPCSSTTVSSTPSAIPTSITPISWASRSIAWITNVAATCISKVGSTAFSWCSSKLIAMILLFVFWTLFVLSTWSYEVLVTVDPGFLPENEWPYTGDPFGSDHFIPYHTSSTSDVLGRSHTFGTSRVFDSTHTLDSTLGSFHPIVTSYRTVNVTGNADRMINMKGCYLWYWDDEETRLWVAKQWEELSSSANNEKPAGHSKSDSKSIRRSKWKKNPKAPAIALENGVSNTFVNDVTTTNTRAARVSNPFHSRLDKEASDIDIEGGMSDAGIGVDIGVDMDVRDTNKPITSGEDRKTDFNHKQAKYANTGKGGELSDHPLSLYDQKMLYKMAVNHYFDTVFSDNERILASGILEASEFTNPNSTAYVAGRSPAGRMNDPAGYIHRHGGAQPVDNDPTGYVQNPVKHERIRPIQYNLTRPIQYDPFRRIFVPYGAKYSDIYDKYVVGLQTYAPLMMKWISVFIGKPIGFRNQKAFSLFLLYSGMLSCYVLVVLGGIMLGVIWNLKSLALIEAKESKFLVGSLNDGLVQKSSRKEQMGPETNEDITGKSTKNEVKVNTSDRESNITDNNCMTTTAEVALDAPSTTVSFKINYLFKSYYINLVVVGWYFLHGICSVSMMQDGLWNGQHGFWHALNNGMGSPYIGDVRSIVCSFLPHEACLERNTIQDYVVSTKGAAFAEIQDANDEYPSSDSNHAYTSSQRNSIAQSFLQAQGVTPVAWPPGTPVHQPVVRVIRQAADAALNVRQQQVRQVIFEETRSDGLTRCQIFADDIGLHEAFTQLHTHCRGVLSFKKQLIVQQRKFTLGIDAEVKKEFFKKPNPMLGKPGDYFIFEALGMGAMGGAYRFLSPRHCQHFVVKVQFPSSETSTNECGKSFQQCLKKNENIANRLKVLRNRDPRIMLIPQPPLIANSKVGDVLFLPFAAGGEVLAKVTDITTGRPRGDPRWFSAFFKSLLGLMMILDDMMYPQTGTVGLVHRDIKLDNLVFTTDNSENALVGIIDWDLLVPINDEGKWNGNSGTALYIPWGWDSLSRQWVAQANDEYALMMSATGMLLGHQPVYEVYKHDPQGRPYLVKTFNELSEAIDGTTFPVQNWGKRHPNDKVKLYYNSWAKFLYNYFKLWAVQDGDKRCFVDNHVDITFRKILENDVPQYHSGRRSEFHSGYCETVWKKVHDSLTTIVRLQLVPEVFSNM